jgi:alkylation response protein AidB-like acyl-CoA dehydrogenase
MPNSSEDSTANFFAEDHNLQQALTRTAPALLAAERDRLNGFGAWVAGPCDAQADYSSRLAPPVLEAVDTDGRLVTQVRHNPLYEAASREVYSQGIVGLNYGESPKPYLLTFAMGYLLAQSDISIHCPVTLTGAVAYVLDRYAPDDVKAAYLPALARMDGTAHTGGTWVTERQGGSDVGATETTAQQTNAGYSLSGLKWFTSNADGDLALATARPDAATKGTSGLGLYLVPKIKPDGEPNGYWIRRLKDKLGTRGLATGEIELVDTFAVEIAPPPEGFKMMMAALEFSRVQNAVAAAGMQRRAFREALNYANERNAFGQSLASQPMVRDQLFRMQADLEASLALSLEAARAFDAAQEDEAAAVWLRTITALAKYLTAEYAITAASQSIEILGGIGYTEEYVTARLLRDAQVLTVWEGPPNIQALELIRLVGGRYAGFEAFATRVLAAAKRCEGPLAAIAPMLEGSLSALTASAKAIQAEPKTALILARKLLDRMSVTMATALLVEEAAGDLELGDARKALIACHYAETRLELGWPRLSGEEPAIHRHFEAVTGYETIDT